MGGRILQKAVKAEKIIKAVTGQRSSLLSKVNRTPSGLRVQKVPTWLKVKKDPFYGARPKSSLGRDIKRFRKMRNWKLLKEYLKTLTGKNFIDKFKFGMNQLSLIFNQDKVDPQRLEMGASVKRTERDLLRRMFTNKRYVRDFSVLSSSWCHSATWFNTVGSSSAGMSGILNLTVKQETKKGTKIGRTYSYHGVSMMTWAMMKSAMGREGTGAGTVFGRTYLKGYRASPEVPPFQGSEQRLI